MKLRLTIAGAAALALAVPTVVGAAPAVTKVTGGGQTLTDGKDTIGFNAQTDGSTVKGQVQFVDRAADGSSQTQYHGDVFCVQVVDDGDNATPVNAAIISGTWRSINGDSPTDVGDYYTLYVEDNGEGVDAQADQIVMSPNVSNDDDTTGPTCENEIDPSDAQPVLGHGNVQFHKGKAQRSSRTSAAKKRAPKVVSLAGLR